MKDYGPDAVTPLTLRAKYIEIADGGELWIGSRKCRYQGKADIVLYGNKEDMPSHNVVGEKYLWTDKGGTLEIHGKEKKSWTKACFEHIRKIFFGLSFGGKLYEGDPHSNIQTLHARFHRNKNFYRTLVRTTSDS